MFLAGSAGGLDAGGDAAAGAGDLLITGAIQTQVEFVGAVAAENQMRVAIDQAGRDQRAVEGLDGISQRGRVAGQIDHAPEPGDPAVMHRDRAVLDQPVRLLADKGGERCIQQ